MTYKTLRDIIRRKQQVKATNAPVPAIALCAFVDLLMEHINWPEESWDPSPSYEGGLEGLFRPLSFGKLDELVLRLRMEKPTVAAEVRFAIRPIEGKEGNWDIIST